MTIRRLLVLQPDDVVFGGNGMVKVISALSHRVVQIASLSINVLLVIMPVGSTVAAEFRCRQPKELGQIVNVPDDWTKSPLGPFRWTGKASTDCLEASLEGQIVGGDADKLEWLLGGYEGPISKSPHRLYLSSPGGNVLEAMTMGRLLRTRFVRTRTNCPGNQMCCASACALTYYGGAAWRVSDRLGLHRPTSEDAADIDYLHSREIAVKINDLIKNYFTEMEVPMGNYETMMRTPPDQIAVVSVRRQVDENETEAFPISIYDWLLAKCKTETLETRSMCMSFALEQPLSDDAEPEEVKQFTWYAYKSIDQLRDILSYDPSKFGRLRIGSIREAAAKHELELRSPQK